MITIFDVPQEVRKTLPIKNINKTIDLVANSLQKQGLDEDEIKEIVSSKSFWVGLVEVVRFAL